MGRALSEIHPGWRKGLGNFVRAKRLHEELRSLLSLIIFVLCVAFALQSWELAFMWAAVLGVHEIGHILVLSMLGIDWKMGFGPLGAWTETPAQERRALSHFQNALVHLAGPIFSILYALLALALHVAWQPGSDHLLRLASLSTMIGLFNLLPLGTLSDGGKIVHRVLNSLDEEQDREMVLLLVFLSLFLVVGSIVVVLVKQGYAEMPTMFQIVGALVMAGLMLLAWILASEYDVGKSGRPRGHGRIVRRVILGLMLTAPVMLGVVSGVNTGSLPQFNWTHLPPQLVGFLLVMLWLSVGVLLASRRDDPAEAYSHRAMSRSRAYLLILGMCALLAVGTVITLSIPYWLTRAQVVHTVTRHVDLAVRGWRLVAPVVGFALLIGLLMVLHELGHYVVAALSGILVNRIVVGSPKGKLFVRFELAGQTVEIYRRVPVFMALDVDDEALLQAGFWRRSAFALAGPLTNLFLVLLTGWAFLGAREGTALALDFMSDTVHAIATFFLTPLGVGSSLEFLNGPLQATVATARASGLSAAAAWWMLLNTLIGIANLIPLPALDGGLVLLSLLMGLGRRRGAAAATFDRWYKLAPHVAAWLPWAFIGMTAFHVVNLFVMVTG